MDAKMLLSAITALFFALAGYFVMLLLNVDHPFVFAGLSSLLCYLLMFPLWVIYEKVMNKRYAKIEKEITSPVFFKANSNFNLANGKVKNGNIYFCDVGIICVSGEKPYTLDEIPLQNISRITHTLSHLTICTSDGRLFIITTPKAKEIVAILTQKGRITQE